ncbi:MAG: hypothetical protein HOC23_14305 [Halieaceae bacterium]|jgi:LPS-assembly lipoprotein|nr:hypothetical protein [Halieaceae bacterium]
MYRHSARLTTAIFALTCLVSACGFQLRGTGGTGLPEEWKSMYLATSSPNSELSRELSSNFSANGILWVDSDQANFTLNLGPERFNQRNLSINSQARASEFELSLTAEFSVLNAGRIPVIENSTASVVKQMENDPRNVVGKAEEIRILKDEMRTELVQQIMRRIGYFATSTQ